MYQFVIQFYSIPNLRLSGEPLSQHTHKQEGDVGVVATLNDTHAMATGTTILEHINRRQAATATILVPRASQEMYCVRNVTG